jgi:hypothetical protein
MQLNHPRYAEDVVWSRSRGYELVVVCVLVGEHTGWHRPRPAGRFIDVRLSVPLLRLTTKPTGLGNVDRWPVTYRSSVPVCRALGNSCRVGD